MTYCACGHHESRHHPAGACAVTLPPFEEEELPAWRCPCRRLVASTTTTLLLRSVQSCTVAGAAAQEDLRPELLELAPRAVNLPVPRRRWLVGRTHP